MFLNGPSPMMLDITKCYTRATRTSAIAPLEKRASIPYSIASNDFFLRQMFNSDAASHLSNRAQIENHKSRFARMLSRSKLRTGLFENVERQMPRIGDVRFVVEHIDADRFEKLARERGWKDGEDGMLDYAEHFEAAIHTEHKTLDEAKAAAKAFLAKGQSLFGCCTIDRQVFERFEPDMHPEWERYEMYEVAMDGEMIDVAA